MGPNIKVEINKKEKPAKGKTISFFKLLFILVILMVVVPIVLIAVYPIIILFILILIPIALVCIIFKGKDGTAIGLQLNFDFNNASLIDTHKNKEIKEGIDNILEYTKGLNKNEEQPK